MDRDLRLRAPHRRTARPADPPRQHPRDERRELSPRQQHCPKAATKVLRSDRSLWPKEANAPWHAPAIGKRARHGAGHCHLAWFCAAAWPDFAPPLTDRAARHYAVLILAGALSVCAGSGVAVAQSASVERPAATHPYAAHIAEASQRFGIPEHWIRAVLRAESTGDVRAVSMAGAMGLMQ